MALPTTFVYDKRKADFLKKLLNIDAAGDALKAMLLTAAYTPAPAVDDVYSDISASEVAGTGYTAGGAAVAGQAVTITAANSWGTAWAAATAYTAGKVVRPTTGNGYVYRVTVAGTSHATTEPTWPQVVGQTVVDNGVTWTCAGTSVIKWACTNPSWAAATITARYCVVYDTTVSNKLVLCLDFGANVSSTAGTFTVTLDAATGGLDLF